MSPYIKKHERGWFDNEIERTLKKLVTFPFDERVGKLNYIFTKLLLGTLPNEVRYHHYNALIGTLECCKQELYRKRIASYETEKAKLHGEVY